jgi:hypothetical protein
MTSKDERVLDDPQRIVDEIDALATGKSRKFRTLIGKTGNNLPRVDADRRLSVDNREELRLANRITTEPKPGCLGSATFIQCLRQVSAFFHVQVSRPV